MLRAFAWGTSVLSILLGAYYGREIPFSEQWPLYEALRTTAAIIFAVVGAWIAIMFPERMKYTFKVAGGKPVAERAGIGRFFTPIVHSTAVLCIILILGFIAPVAKRIDYLLQYTEALRGASYAALVALTLFQLWTVVLSLGPAHDIKETADTDAATSARRYNRKRMGSSARKPAQPDTQ